MTTGGHPISRRSLIALAAAATSGVALGPLHPAAAASPATVRSRRSADLSQQLLREWAQAPASHPLIGDFTRAGYHLGTETPKTPRTANPPVVVNVMRYGARGDGVADDATAFNEAVRAAGESGGGVVLVPAGTYHLGSPVWMHWSNVVLRGTSTESTVLHFSRPLRDGYRNNWQDSQGQSRWSWAGGQIWVIPEPVLRKLEDEEWLGTEGWVPGAALTGVAPATRGTRELTVSSTADLREGQMVLLDAESPADAGLLVHLAGDTEAARNYDWSANAPQLVPGADGFYPQYGSLQWPVRIEEIVDDITVRIAQPLKHDLRPEWPSLLRELGPAVTEVGVENLTIYNELLPQTSHNENPGSNGVHFQAAHDCWANDVRVVNCDVAFGLTAAKSVSVSGAVIGGRACHHPFVCRMQSHDNLVENFTIEPFTVPLVDGALLHGINVEGLSSGNVYRAGVMAEGTFDSHRGLPFENTRTNIAITNTGVVGGSSRSGPYFGARMSHWGIDVANDRPYAVCIGDVAPRSATVGVGGVRTDTSGLEPDYPGGREALDNATELDAFAVEDLHTAQRRLLAGF